MPAVVPAQLELVVVALVAPVAVGTVEVMAQTEVMEQVTPVEVAERVEAIAAFLQVVTAALA
jgi:hypothetical protein